MATYPALPQRIGSSKEVLGGYHMSRAVSGRPIFYNYYSQTRNVFNITHELSNSDKQLIDTHYGTDRMLGFSFTFAGDGVAYTVRYAEAPKCTPIEGANRWLVEVTLIEQ